MQSLVSDGSDFVWGLGLISQITSGGSATYAQSDGLGSTRPLSPITESVAGCEGAGGFCMTFDSAGSV